MADNVTLNAGSGGDTIAADDISSAKYQRIKLVHGADGTNDGDVSTANPYPTRLYLGTTAVSAGAGAVGTGVPRVTLASDDPAVVALQILDNAISGNEMQVDIVGALPAGANVIGAVTQSGTWNVVCTNAGTFAVQVDGPALTALQLIDNLVLTEDAAHASGDAGVQALAVRKATPTDLSGADGDYEPLQVSAGRLWVDASGKTLTVASHDVTNAGTFAVQAAQSGTWNIGTVTTVTTVSTVTSVTAIGTSVTPGTSATHLGKAVDSAAGGTDTGVAALALRDDALATLTPADGDYTHLRVNDSGALWVTVTGTVTVGSHAVTNAGTFAVQESGAALTALQVIDDWDESDRAKVNPIVGQAGVAAGAGAVGATVQRMTLASDDPAVAALQIMDDWDNAASDGASVSGDVAHDTADAGEPVKQGFKATTALSGLTLVANNDRTNGFAGIDGVQIVRPHCNLEDIVTGNTSNTDGTSTSVIASAGAGVKQYLTSCILTNTSSSNIYVELKSGTTVMATIPLPANSGAIFNPPVPLKPNAADEAWSFDPSAATTTVYCTMIGFKSKV